MMKQTYQTLTFILACSITTHAGFQMKPRIGYDLNTIAITQDNEQNIPQLPLTDAQFNATSAINTNDPGSNARRYIAANTIYFPTDSNSPFAVSKDNLDAANFRHLYTGLEISYIDEDQRPSDSYQIAPVVSGYLLLEDATEATIQAGAYKLTALNSAGADCGLLITNNGNYLQLGAGARFFQGEFETSVLFAAMSTVSAAGIENIDVSSLQSIESDGDKKPFIAKIESLMLPYAYAELSSEIGDIATVFVKLQYGLPVSPEFTDTPSNTQMFSGDQEAFEKNINFQQFAATFGIEARLTDLGVF